MVEGVTSPRVRSLQVAPSHAGMRLDRVLAAAWPDLSRSAIQRAIEAGRVRLGGVPAKASLRLRGGEAIVCEEEVPVASELVPVELPLEILHEDAAVLVLNKPSGLVVHPGAGTTGDTLVHRLLAHCKGSLSGIGGVERPGILHRLDRETSGVMVVAKNDAAHVRLARDFHDRKVRKVYGVLVCGVPRDESGSWTGAIGRHPTQRHRMRVCAEGGRAARTDWTVHERFGEIASWLLCDIKTGRTHQIRVHCQHARLPVLGDRTYGWKSGRPEGIVPERVMLHARELEFRHPLTRRVVAFQAPWPEDFQKQVRALRAVVRAEGA